MSAEATLIWAASATDVRVVSADANISYGHSRAAETTDYLIEDGEEASDHIVLKPETLALELVQSETPIPSADPEMKAELADLKIRQSEFRPGGALAITAAIGSVVQAGLGAVGLGSDPTVTKIYTYQRTGDADRIAEFHDLLLEMQASKSLIQVIVGNRTYEDLALIGVAASQSGTDQFGSFKLDFKKIRKAPAASAALGLGLPSPGDLALKAALAAAKAAAKLIKPADESISKKSIALALAEGNVFGAGALLP